MWDKGSSNIYITLIFSILVQYVLLALTFIIIIICFFLFASLGKRKSLNNKVMACFLVYNVGWSVSIWLSLWMSVLRRSTSCNSTEYRVINTEHYWTDYWIVYTQIVNRKCGECCTFIEYLSISNSIRHLAFAIYHLPFAIYHFSSIYTIWR